MTRAILFLGIITIFLLLSCAVATAVGKASPSHMDKIKNPEGCAACHSGRGSVGTPMLKEGYATVCFRCHGERGRGKSQYDVESVFQKSSTHPIFETGALHSSGERLPERDSEVKRHVSCFDCHRAHVSAQGMPMAGIKGYAPGPVRSDRASGRRFRDAQEDYELCYLCHSTSANLPEGSTNKAVEFNPDNPSYHPVEAEGRNQNVPSLRGGLQTTDRIQCGSCHGSNEIIGPQGPHGSDYAPLLVARYRMEDGPESANDYDLCYTCHERRSILNDESFKRHSLHVNQEDTSCHTCHDPHGSTFNTNLIEFNESVVSPSDVSGGPSYRPGASGTPQCFLKCHGIDHNNNGIGEKPWPY